MPEGSFSLRKLFNNNNKKNIPTKNKFEKNTSFTYSYTFSKTKHNDQPTLLVSSGFYQQCFSVHVMSFSIHWVSNNPQAISSTSYVHYPMQLRSKNSENYVGNLGSCQNLVRILRKTPSYNTLSIGLCVILHFLMRLIVMEQVSTP